MQPDIESRSLLITSGTWLDDVLVPWWRKHIVDPHGGYFEALAGDGTVNVDARRTTLNQARLTYVFSHAAIRTGDALSLRAAAHGFDFLKRRCRDAATGGWFRAVDVAGGIVDPVHDAYDHAFVLFALAWYGRATGDASCRSLAGQTWAFMLAHLADPVHGGFVEEVGIGPQPRPRFRRQNPHMHLLEACLAWHATDPDGPWLERSAAIVDLFQRKFRDAANGTLIEYFADDWTPAPGADGLLREPGHHFEWTWLLLQYQRHGSGPELTSLADALWQFGLAHGVDRDMAPRDLAFDGVDASGTLIADTKLLWPQTELIKACTARVESVGDASACALGWSTYAQMHKHYFDAAGVRWVNQLTRDGRTCQPVAPARILYHVFLAVTELDRVMGATAPPGPSFAASPGIGQDGAANALGHHRLSTGELP